MKSKYIIVRQEKISAKLTAAGRSIEEVSRERIAAKRNGKVVRMKFTEVFPQNNK